MRFQPFIVGSGMSGQAIAKALSIADIVEPAIDILAPIRLKRDHSLAGLVEGVENPVLCIGNPHGLHAKYVLEGCQAGFRDFILDKPVCVTTGELECLRGVSADVAVLHGFRVMWGPQTIQRMLEQGTLGDVITIEGRYWQSSAAEIAVSDDPPRDKAWKSDVALNGEHDTFVDLGSHWTDLMLFLAGEKPRSVRSWLSYANALAPHRDTHGHLYLEFSRFRTLGSISKTMHGAANHLEINVIGSKQSVTWLLGRPDELRVGHANRVTQVRKTADRRGAQHPPFHGVGWLEGYTEVVRSFLLRKAGEEAPPVPTLPECLDVMEVLLTSAQL